MGKRRGKGEGSIFKRKDGSWVAEVTSGFDEQGKRKTKTLYARTKSEVQRKLQEYQSNALSGLILETERLTVAQYLERWIESRTGLRKSTVIDYKGVINNHLNPHLGGIPLGKLTPLHVQGMLGSMKRKGSSAQILKKAYNILHGALAQAVKWRLMPRNVCAEVEKPKATNKTFQVFNAEEAQRFLEAAKADRLYALYLLAITTGLRQGELFALRWCDIDYEAKTLSVVHSLVELNGHLELGAPKSKSSRRVVVLPDIAVTELREHQKRMMKEGVAGQWVFCDTKGNLLRKSNVSRRSFVPLLNRAELPRIRFHDLRHSMATLLMEQGVHIKVVSERMGHSGVALTLNTYTHVSRTLQDDAADKLNSILSGPPRLHTKGS